MTRHTSASIKLSVYRNGGRAAIASGVAGILSIAFLIFYLGLRSSRPDDGLLMNRIFDMGLAIQYLLWIPLASALQKLSQKRPPGIRQLGLDVGIGAICFVILYHLLIFPGLVSDILYMIPQGVFGVWLIFVSTRLKGMIPGGLRWLGMIAGLGLALVGIFPIGFAIFVDPMPVQIPPGPPKEFPNTTANSILHQLLFIGSIMGVLTLPVWTILTGRRLLQLSGGMSSPVYVALTEQLSRQNR